jgi:hypothetical protein
MQRDMTQNFRLETKFFYTDRNIYFENQEYCSLISLDLVSSVIFLSPAADFRALPTRSDISIV